MQSIETYDANSILSESLLTEIFEEEDKIKQARLILDCQDRAKTLGVKQKFDMLVKAYEKTFKEIDKAKKNIFTVDGYTNFTFPIDSTYCNMRCGAWQASDDGIYAPISNSPIPITACYHPIFPYKRLKNMETGEEQITLVYKRNHKWIEITVPKDIISSASKIVSLSKVGISVTSENAKYLVKYLADIENFNDDDIEIQNSTSKLGWRGTDFIPYDTSIVFDGDARFRSLFNSIHEQGEFAVWLEHVKEIRQQNRIESKLMLAGSFASALIKKLETLPFIIDLWGETEGGKSVSLMLAASVWGNPDESQYIGDFKTTDVALEAKADMLNNLPMMLDDTSKTSSRIRDNFEGIVYDLCSGKGKSRSNKELGMNRENHWKLCILTNGEKPLNSYVSQGGAINRILEVECGPNIYKDPQTTANIIKRNYGFAGWLFVNVVKMLGDDEIKRIYNELCEELFTTDKMQKQAMSLAVVLTADRIATDNIFMDGQYISLDEAKKTLIDRDMVSDNERCYRYLVDKVNMNKSKFDDLNVVGEKWGTIDIRDGRKYAVFYQRALDELCEQGGFSKKSFLSWANKNGKLLTDGIRNTKNKKIDGTSMRCIFLMIYDGTEFVEVDDHDDEVPFNT